MPDINDKYVVYYAVRGYRTGQTVTIDIYDTLGAKEVNTQTMTELSTTGIYGYNFRPRKRTSYTAVMNCAAYPKKAHQVIRVEKQKLGGAVKIHRVDVPDPIWKEKDKRKVFLALQNLPLKFPKPITPEIDKFPKEWLEKLLSSSKKEILNKILSSLPDEKLNEALLSEFFDRHKTHFENFEQKFNDKFLELSSCLDETLILQKLNVPPEKSRISPEEDTKKLMIKYDNSRNGSSHGKETL